MRLGLGVNGGLDNDLTCYYVLRQTPRVVLDIRIKGFIGF